MNRGQLDRLFNAPRKEGAPCVFSNQTHPFVRGKCQGKARPPTEEETSQASHDVTSRVNKSSQGARRSQIRTSIERNSCAEKCKGRKKHPIVFFASLAHSQIIVMFQTVVLVRVDCEVV